VKAILNLCGEMSREEASMNTWFEVTITRQGVGDFIVLACQPLVHKLDFGL
jgi:hypothetical protein